jgi:hypothetical protein
VIVQVLRHIRNGDTCWFLFTDKLIEEEALNTNTEVSVCHDGSVLSLPIEDPISVKGNRKISIRFLELKVACVWNTLLKTDGNSRVNQIDNCTNEKYFKSGGEVRPDVTPDLDVNIPSVNVSGHIYTVDSGDVSSVSKSFDTELETEANLNSVDDDIKMTLCDKRPLFVSERVVVKDTGESVTAHNNCVLTTIRVDQDIVRTFVQNERVTLHVVALVVLEVRDLEVVDQGDDVVEVGVLSLLQDSDVHGGFNTGGQV